MGTDTPVPRNWSILLFRDASRIRRSTPKLWSRCWLELSCPTVWVGSELSGCCWNQSCNAGHNVLYNSGRDFRLRCMCRHYKQQKKTKETKVARKSPTNSVLQLIATCHGIAFCCFAQLYIAENVAESLLLSFCRRLCNIKRAVTNVVQSARNSTCHRIHMYPNSGSCALTIAWAQPPTNIAVWHWLIAFIGWMAASLPASRMVSHV